MENNNHIDLLFKGALKNFESRPLNDIWSQIEERLNNEEAPVARINYARYASILFIFISLCFISVPVVKKSDSFTDGIAFEIPAANSVETIIQDNRPEPENVFQASAAEILDEIPSAIRDYSRSNEVLIQPIASLGFPENEEEFIFVPDEEVEDQLAEGLQTTKIERIFNNDIPMNAFTTAGRFQKKDNYEVEDREIDDSRMKIELRGMYLGVSGSYQQTSLIEYGNFFRGERPIQPSLKFGTAKGVALGYNFNNKFGLQADYIYNSIQGQNYVTSEEGEIIEKTLALYYDHIQLTSNFKQARMSDFTKHPAVINYIAGIQYGMLRNYRVPQEKRWETSEELFKQYDWSIVLGLDYELYLQKNLFLSLGARGTLSNDISSHNIPLDDYAKRNFVFGVRGGLNYVFR